ncbi:hypothetical protein B0H19DRAFT_1156467 [Mycena capillaripes]|nr:hypothetical protein B0H19DRAFT_1156467 [Mycena capillaripes]
MLFVLIRFFFPLVLLPSFVSVSVLCFRYFCGILWMGFFFFGFCAAVFFHPWSASSAPCTLRLRAALMSTS